MPNSRLIDGQFAVGDPCWYDLSTSDPARSANFYSQVFGWTFEPAGKVLGDEAKSYQLATIGERKVAGLGYVASVATREPGWWVHFAAPDISSMTKQVRELGGQADEPIRIAGQGQLAVARDPQGAGFGLWNPGMLRSPASSDTAGTAHWVELLTADAGAVAPFYEELFGVKAVPVAAKDGDASGSSLNLRRIELGQPRMVAAIQGVAAADVGNPGWRTYFLTDNVTSTKHRVVDAGGTVLEDLHDASSREVAIVADIDGAEFGLVQRGPGSRG